MSVLITTEILGEHPVLTSVNTKLDLVNAWVRSGDGLVGFGEYKKFEVKGKDRFNEAKTWWEERVSEFKIQNNVHGSGTGPILFSSFSFDPKERSVLVIPEIIIGQKNGKSWITWIGDNKQPDLEKSILHQLVEKSLGRKAQFQSKHGSLKLAAQLMQLHQIN